MFCGIKYDVVFFLFIFFRQFIYVVILIYIPLLPIMIFCLFHNENESILVLHLSL